MGVTCAGGEICRSFFWANMGSRRRSGRRCPTVRRTATVDGGSGCRPARTSVGTIESCLDLILVGSRVEVRLSRREALSAALDIGLACRRRWCFAEHQTATAPEHVRALRAPAQIVCQGRSKGRQVAPVETALLEGLRVRQLFAKRAVGERSEVASRAPLGPGRRPGWCVLVVVAVL